MKKIYSSKGVLIVVIFLLFLFCLVGCNETSPVDEPNGKTTPIDEPNDIMPPIDEPADESGESATDYIGLSVNRVIEFLGDDYEIVEGNSTGLHYQDSGWIFYVGEILPEGFEFKEKDIVKFVDAFDGQVIKNVFIGDSAEEIANELGIVDFDLEVDQLDGGYFLGYETELNGYESYVSFYFESQDGPCISAWAKSDELY